jgi:acyl-coenzyme A thioesterase PaaI-like protein
MNIRFMAPVRDRIVAHARVLKVGRALCPIVVDLVDEKERMVAHAGMTYMRLGREEPPR